ncbi:MAG: YdcF family protein, partial [Actinomycetota bacterium]
MATVTATHRWRRAVRPGVLAVVGMAILFVVLTVRWFLYPQSVEPDAVDAVVVLAGGSGERLGRALELLEDPAGPVADTLVLSIGNGAWPGAGPVEVSCGDRGAVDVICFEPVPDSTKGEAIAIGRLAEERGWRRIALVTSDYHLHRAMLRVERCADAEVLPVAAAARTTPGRVF